MCGSYEFEWEDDEEEETEEETVIGNDENPIPVEIPQRQPAVVE